MAHVLRTLFAPTSRTRRVTLSGLIDLARQRRQLKGLSDSQLSDIGLDSHMAGREAARPFWDVPSHWRQN